MDGNIYKSVEAAYVASKTLSEGERTIVRLADTPEDCKRIGKTLKLRPGWNEMRIPVMRVLLEQKFAAGSDLARWLLETGEAELVEGNFWGDTFWGVCRGRGENNLGRLLMEIRSTLNKTNHG